MRRAREKIRRRRCDDKNVCALCQMNVIERVSCAENFAVCPSAGDCFERDGTHKLECRARHHDIDFGARLRQQASEHYCLVACNSPRDAKENAAAVEWPQSSYSVRRRGITRYSISPRESSSSARVVSFFSPLAERSLGNSL